MISAARSLRRRARTAAKRVVHRLGLKPRIDRYRHRRMLLAGADQLYRHGVFGITADVEDWALFVRNAPLGHYYSPVPSLRTLSARADTLFGTFPESLPGIDLAPALQEETFVRVASELAGEEIPEQHQDGWRYHSANPFYGIGDGLMLHGLLRVLRPRRIVEIGSGWSSALILDTVDRHLDPSTELHFVEPHPERLEQLLRDDDRARVTIHVDDVQNVDPKIFEQLESGDLLFIDSSHVVTIGSDVPYLTGNVLPILPSGVVVHVHDIFWPFELPREWFDEGRVWAEPYLWRAFLTHNSEWDVLFFNHWFASARRDVVERHLPRMLSSGTDSLWLRRR